MPGESPTKWQAQAYRFGVRRLESAVSAGDPLLRGDPVRRRLNIAVIVSLIVAVLLLGGFAVYGFIKPDPSIGGASVVIDEDTGGVYVARADRLYPAMNLASALLAAGRGSNGDNAPSRTTVSSDTIGKEPRGPLLGIPGAPNVLPSGSALIAPRWTVCDTTSVNAALPPGSAPTVRTTAILGERAPRAGAITQTRAMLVSADKGATTYLVWDGRKSRIDTGDSTIQLAFGIGSNATPRPISASLLDVIPEAPDITPPTINTGAANEYTNSLGVGVGDVFGLKRANNSQEIYVALPNGYQQITPLVGDLIRDRYNEAKQLPLVEPVLLRQAPRVPDAQAINLDNFPVSRPRIVTYQQAPAVCASRTGTSSASLVFALRTVPLPGAAKTVTVTRPGSLTVDDVYVQPGHGAVFSSTTSSQDKSARALFLVTDDGVAYPIVSAAALTSLGYHAADVAATAPELISLLPAGPTLDPDAAAHFYPQTGVSARSLPTASPAGQSSSG